MDLKKIGYRIAGHKDFASAGYVLTAVTTGRYNICLFDTAYLSSKAEDLYKQEHIPNAKHFNIDRVIAPTATERRALVHPLIFQVCPIHISQITISMCFEGIREESWS